MTNFVNEYSSLKINIGSGSIDWVEVKSDFVYFDDTLVGIISDVKHENFFKEKISEYKTDINSFMERVNSYTPKDNIETNEKGILIKKISLAEKIADLALLKHENK